MVDETSAWPPRGRAQLSHSMGWTEEGKRIRRETAEGTCPWCGKVLPDRKGGRIYCPGDNEIESWKWRFAEAHSVSWVNVKIFTARRAMGRCEVCQWTPYKEPVRDWSRPVWGGLHFEFDHKLEIALGGEPLDRANVQMLCRACHAKKTAEFNSKRGRLRRRGIGCVKLEAFAT